MFDSFFNTPNYVIESSTPDQQQCDESSIIILLNQNQLKSLPYHEVLSKRLAQKIKQKDADAFFITSMPNEQGSSLIIFDHKQKLDAFTFTDKLTKAFKKIDALDGKIIIMADSRQHETLLWAMRTILAHDVKMPNYKSQPGKAAKESNVDEVIIYASKRSESSIKEVYAQHFGNALARYLITLPTNYLQPTHYVECAKELADQEGWQFEFYDCERLEALGAEAFLAVARASEGAGIVKLTYTPTEAFHRTLSLVGKGVCFDTGGVSIKPPQYMYGMHEDMGGSAVALGSLLMLSRLEVDYEVECWLAIVDNKIGKEAYLPNEVVRAINGVTIEVVDTDAEGRMALSDTLCLASQSKPDLLIDYATLTGASIRSVGTRYSTVFSNCEDWLEQLIDIGRQSGERVWPMPMSDEYLEDIKSDIADIKQCNVVGNADHIHAAKFLEKFVDKDIRWLHMDMAACHHKGGLGAIPHDYTGFGVWFTESLLRGVNW